MFAAFKKDKSRINSVIDALDIPIWQRNSARKLISANDTYKKLSESSEELNELSKEVTELTELAFSTKLPLV